MVRFIKRLVVLLVWLGSSSLIAQDSEDLMNLTLEELLGIEVTAQKRVEKLLDAPVAVAVLMNSTVRQALSAARVRVWISPLHLI